MSSEAIISPGEGPQADWDAARQDLLDEMLAASPAQRLAWLEEALRLERMLLGLSGMNNEIGIFRGFFLPRPTKGSTPFPWTVELRVLASAAGTPGVASAGIAPPAALKNINIENRELITRFKKKIRPTQPVFRVRTWSR